MLNPQQTTPDSQKEPLGTTQLKWLDEKFRVAKFRDLDSFPLVKPLDRSKDITTHEDQAQSTVS